MLSHLTSEMAGRNLTHRQFSSEEFDPVVNVYDYIAFEEIALQQDSPWVFTTSNENNN